MIVLTVSCCIRDNGNKAGHRAGLRDCYFLRAVGSVVDVHENEHPDWDSIRPLLVGSPALPVAVGLGVRPSASARQLRLASGFVAHGGGMICCVAVTAGT